MDNEVVEEVVRRLLERVDVNAGIILLYGADRQLFHVAKGSIVELSGLGVIAQRMIEVVSSQGNGYITNQGNLDDLLNGLKLDPDSNET